MQRGEPQLVKMPGKTIIRPLTPADQAFLWEMLFLSLYVRPGGEAFAREILRTPELARYAEDWGRAGDIGFVAEDASEKPIGAAWMRLFTADAKGYGYVDDQTPELGMAIMPEFRGKGIGTLLLDRLLKSANGKYDFVSLSVDTSNPALRLYKKFGFKAERSGEGFLVMKRRCS